MVRVQKKQSIQISNDSLIIGKPLKGFRFNEPTREIIVLFVLYKRILQTRMPRDPVGLDVRFLVGPFV